MDDPVLRVQSQLTGRDRILLGWLYDHGVLTTFQIAHALFPSLDFAQRRLRTLHRLRLVARFRPQRPTAARTRTTTSSTNSAPKSSPPPRRTATTPRPRPRRTAALDLQPEPGRTGSAINQFFTDLAGHARTHPGAELRRVVAGVGMRREPAPSPAQTIPALVRAYQPRVRPDGYGLWAERRRRGAVLRRVRHRRRAAVSPARQADRLPGPVRHDRTGVAGAVLAALRRPGTQPAPPARRRAPAGAGRHRCPRSRHDDAGSARLTPSGP